MNSGSGDHVDGPKCVWLQAERSVGTPDAVHWPNRGIVRPAVSLAPRTETPTWSGDQSIWDISSILFRDLAVKGMRC